MILLLIIILSIAVQTDTVQNWLVNIATNKISKELGTEVSVKSVSFSLFNKANINGLFVADKNKDTILYAGNLNVSITDWFFFKSKAEIKHIGLQDAVIKLNRKDSVWNYQYIINHFASTDTTPKKKGGQKLDLKEIDFKNIKLIKNDEWRGEIITATVSRLQIETDSLNFDTNKLYVKNIKVQTPNVNIQKIKGNRPADYVFPIVAEVKEENPLLLVVKDFEIEKATLAINHDYDKPASNFDGAHILFSPLNASFKNFKIHSDTLFADLNLNAKERSGLELKQLKAKFKFTPRIMELKQMDLRLNKSHLTNYYAMKFKNFDDDFAEYATNVIMDAHFKDSYINSDDVAYFATDLKTWKKELQINGNFLGTVSDFKVENLIAKEKDNSTTITGSLAMKGLPDMDKTIINFNDGTVKTNHKDLAAIIPALKGVNNPDITALGTILFTGSFNGTTSDFETKGTVTTSLGNITTDLSMQLPTKKDPTYSGEIKIDKFDLGKFLKEDKLGIVDFTGKFNGSSFKLANLKTKLDGYFNSFVFNGYNYQNITTNGTFLNKYFKGELKVDDPNFDMNGQVEADLSKPIPSFNILADITKTNLQKLNFVKDELHLTGLLDVYFAGTNIDNFLGSAKLLNASISNANSKLDFDSLTLTSGYLDSIKFLHFAANDFNANINGDFKILDLPNCFQSFLHNYYPSYIAPPSSLPQNQKFAITLNTRYVEPYLQLFDKNIRGFNDAALTGTIDTKNNLFGLGILLPYGKYKNFVVTGAEITGKGSKDSLALKGTVSNFQVSDSLNFPNTNLSIVSSNDLSKIALKTRASNTLNEADLNAKVETSPNGIKINFDPSSFILNDKKWNLDREGEITLYKNFTVAKNVKFVQGFQEISLETAPIDDGNTNSLDVKLKDVVAGDITSLFVKNLRIEGITNGTIHVDDIFGKLNATADIKVDQFRLDDDSIGVAYIKSNYNSKTGLVAANIVSPNKNFDFSIDGFINVKDTSIKPINTVIDLNNTQIGIVQKLIGNDIFSGLNGYATGKLNISGKPNELNLSGKVKLRNAGMKVNYTQVYYKIDEADISFDEDGIDFGEFNIKDTLGNVGTVKGKLYEKNFKKLTFDFDLSTNKLLLLDTKSTDNSQFYGNATGKATLTFKGPEDNCKMTITGEATDQSHITIPNSNFKETSEASFIVFKPIGEEIVEAKKQSNFNLLVDLDLIANNKVDIDVVLDELTGDVITAKGNGRLKIKVGTTEKMDMRGKYNIEEGSYNFNFQSFIRKPFVLKKGDNNFIEWSGDASDANIHIDAMYEAKNISIKDLIGNNAQGTFNSASKSFRDDVYVIATLTGKLMKPDIKFRFDFPQNSPIKNDDVFDRFRKKIESDDNEMLKQVTYLIVFNSFAPYGESSVAQTNFTSIGVNSISALITKQINKSFTNLLYKITKDKSLQFDLSSAVYSSNDLFSQGTVSATSTQFDRYNVKFKIGKSFFSDKVRVNFGSDFDINLRSSTQSGNFQWLPDLNVEWTLNAEKNLLLIVFSKNSLDISGNTLGRRNRQGVGITFKKDFDKSPFEKKNNDVQFTVPPVNPAPPADKQPEVKVVNNG
ncbi:MAG: translocation/assembly module TamB domain-containing protein [Chitinophagaceae bacterium]